MEQLGVQLHHLLQRYPSLRDRWLAGQALATLFDESRFGALAYNARLRSQSTVENSNTHFMKGV